MILFLAGVGIAAISGAIHLILLIVMYARSESIVVTARGWGIVIISFIVMLVGIALAVYAWLRK